jgi:transposase
MSEPQLPREVRRRLAVIRHAEEVTGTVAMTCRYYEISRQVYYRWLRRYQERGIDGLRDLSRRPHHSPNATHVDVIGKIVLGVRCRRWPCVEGLFPLGSWDHW